ncbi:uncharacterized protein DUF3263 [Brevibacterium sanguinis]|uniref:Uncharacterized protein DUF3263 n=2 Tax=Brevibacterium TaxID=1696 RepID=A0A366IKQ2_9MICO|nr:MULTISPECIES: DUF3263 domain-containing protein [Brevibacterium]RBP66363.1 uncharacterized protein DUF3263 [Brevibacterium sanguinis]RBP73014.1 uncharacterized protein DUF3263 [Brevibacterium celere]
MNELERKVLDFEKRHPKYNGAKDDAIRQEFDMSATAYYQILNQLLDSPDALEAEPALINRLRRIREDQWRAYPSP